jgi:hypothetical protein
VQLALETSQTDRSVCDRLEDRIRTAGAIAKLDVESILYELSKARVESSPAAAADSLTLTARKLRACGLAMEALAAATEAVALARSAEELEPLYRAVGTRSDLLSDTGQFAEAARGRLETWLLARRLSDPLRELCAIGNVGNLYSDLGHWELSAQYYKPNVRSKWQSAAGIPALRCFLSAISPLAP